MKKRPAMKRLHRNLFVSTLAFCFLAFNFIGEQTNAKHSGAAETTATPPKTTPTKSVKPVSKSTPKPTPKAKTTPKATAKKIPDAKNKPDQKKADAKNKPPAKSNDAPKTDAKTGEQIIVTATNVTVRQQATAKSARLSSVKLGKILPVVKRGQSFYQVEYESGKTGWISTGYTRDFDGEKRETIYREIGDKYSKTKTIEMANAAEVTEFLRTAQAFAKTDEARADIAYKRFQFTAAALKAIPFGKGDQFPYKNFIKANEKDVVYSEPSGEWYVRTESLWDLHEKFVKTPLAEEIAWTAANTTIPGECEGYINCYLYNIRAQDGEYLNFYPNGKHAQQALINIGSYLEPVVADIKDKAVYTPPSDISDRAEFNRFLTELRAIVSKPSNIEKNKVLKQINDLGEGYK